MKYFTGAMDIDPAYVKREVTTPSQITLANALYLKPLNAKLMEIQPGVYQWWTPNGQGVYVPYNGGVPFID